MIAKKFRVLKSLGQGAMGEVFLVLPPRGEPVALKLLKSSGAESQQAALEQFENEFKVLKKLSHPNIGRIFDYGYDEEQKKVYFTSPWLKGSDLFEATRDISYEKCEEYFVQVLRAINYLHQKGIIHCDLKPGNIYVEDNQVILIDFGLAGYWGQSIVGTPTYLAPEIFRGEHHNVLTDLYALGVIFYNCLTRTQPFSGKSLQEVYDRHRTHTPPPLSRLNSHVPKYMCDITSNLLSKKASERYLSAAAVIEDIDTFSKTRYSVETPETLLSYLPTTSELIGRKEAQIMIDKQIGYFLSEKPKKPYVGLFLHGEHGVGKSKFISQIKTRLQLEKIDVEDVLLPLKESDKKIIMGARALIIEDIENYLESVAHVTQSVRDLAAIEENEKYFDYFISVLEQKILSPDTSKILIIVSATNEEYWEPFIKLFPQEYSKFESVNIKSFNQQETHEFLETIIGQKEIPAEFMSEVFRNTNGNPSLIEYTIKNLIQQGLLFDETGRWSSDLLIHLEDALRMSETPQSLEEHLYMDYESFDTDEKEVVNWLAMASHGLTEKMLGRLTETKKIKNLIKRMRDKKIIRLEDKKLYFIYRSAFVPFLRKIIPLAEQHKRHDRFSQKDIGLKEIDVWYHQSLGNNQLLTITALEKRGDALIHMGEKEKALECYRRLYRSFVKAPLPQRVEWAIKASDILIWIDDFLEALHILSSVEQEIDRLKVEIPLRSRLTITEKKGLALLHQQKFEEASVYFNEGLRLAKQKSDTLVDEVRFLNDLAQIDLVTGCHEKAISKFQEAREKVRKLSKDEIKRVTNNDLGHVYYRLQDYEKATQLLREDVKIFSNLPYREPYARALYTLAECYRAVKKFSKAIKEYERCIKLCLKENLLPILLRAYNGLGNIFLVNEKYDEALKSYQRALEISVHLKDLTTKAALLVNQGFIYRNQENSPQASRRFLLAKQILESKERKMAYENQLLSKCYHELANIAREDKDSLQALSLQVERMKMVEAHATLKSEEFDVKLELAKLYLENRLQDQFVNELSKLEILAKSEEEQKQVAELKEDWQKIKHFTHDQTMKVG